MEASGLADTGAMGDTPGQGSRASSKPELFAYDLIDELIDLDVEWRKSYEEVVLPADALSSEAEQVNELQKKASDPKVHPNVVSGLLYGTLVFSEQRSKYLKLLTLVNRDGFTFCLSQLKRLVKEHYHKVHGGAKERLLWLVGELIKMNVQNTGTLCSLLLRQIRSGCLEGSNLWLARGMLQVFKSHKEWLYTNPKLVPIVVYTFLRLIADHGFSRELTKFRTEEVQFCLMILRKRFSECLVIGRDLVRLLDNVKSVPEIEKFLSELLNDPSSLSPEFSGMSKLLATPTPRSYLQTRLTPLMETQLLFVLQSVKMGSQKRFQTWFTQRYLTDPESDALIPDLIRYICGVYHPPNHVLCSDVVPRWAILGWLLKSVKSAWGASATRLALFYDYLFYDKQRGNIMNVEPAILLMMHSIPKYADITVSLMEFLVFILDKFEYLPKESLQRGVRSAFHTLLEKGVVSTLAPIYALPLLHKKDPLRMAVRELFLPFLKPQDLQAIDKKFGVSALALSHSHPAEEGDRKRISLRSSGGKGVEARGKREGDRLRLPSPGGTAPALSPSPLQVPPSSSPDDSRTGTNEAATAGLGKRPRRASLDNPAAELGALPAEGAEGAAGKTSSKSPVDRPGGGLVIPGYTKGPSSSTPSSPRKRRRRGSLDGNSSSLLAGSRNKSGGLIVPSRPARDLTHHVLSGESLEASGDSLSASFSRGVLGLALQIPSELRFLGTFIESFIEGARAAAQTGGSTVVRRERHSAAAERLRVLLEAFEKDGEKGGVAAVTALSTLLLNSFGEEFHRYAHLEGTDGRVEGEEGVLKHGEDGDPLHWVLFEVASGDMGEDWPADFNTGERIRARSCTCRLLRQMYMREPSVGFRYLLWLLAKGSEGSSVAGATPDGSGTSWSELASPFSAAALKRRLPQLLQPYVRYLQEFEADAGAALLSTASLLEDLRLLGLLCRPMLPVVAPLLLQHPLLQGSRADVLLMMLRNCTPGDIRQLQERLQLNACSIFFGGEDDDGGACAGTCPDTDADVLIRTLSWPSVFQLTVWRLLYSSQISTSLAEDLAPALLHSIVDPNSHPEALQGLQALLKSSPPSASLVETMMQLSPSFGCFCACVMRAWIARKPNRVTMLLAGYLEALSDSLETESGSSREEALLSIEVLLSSAERAMHNLQQLRLVLAAADELSSSTEQPATAIFKKNVLRRSIGRLLSVPLLEDRFPGLGNLALSSSRKSGSNNGTDLRESNERLAPSGANKRARKPMSGRDAGKKSASPSSADASKKRKRNGGEGRTAARGRGVVTSSDDEDDDDEWDDDDQPDEDGSSSESEEEPKRRKRRKAVETGNRGRGGKRKIKRITPEEESP